MVFIAASTARSTKAARLRGRSGAVDVTVVLGGVGEDDVLEDGWVSVGRRVCSGEAADSGVTPLVWKKMKGRPMKMSLR